MPGYSVLDSQLKGNTENVAKYRCPQCHLLLRDAVQPSCGHWLCTDCAVEIFAKRNPHCPRDDCGEELVPEDGQDFFPDRFVRREILAFIVTCAFHTLGCSWEGPLSEYEAHRDGCTFAEETCECGQTMPHTKIALHKKTSCPKSKKRCPLYKLGCQQEKEMTNKELCLHFGKPSDIVSHMELLASYILSLRVGNVFPDSSAPLTKQPPAVGSDQFDSGIKLLSAQTAHRFEKEDDEFSGADLTETCQGACKLPICESIGADIHRERESSETTLTRRLYMFPQSQGAQGSSQGEGASNPPGLAEDQDDLYT